MEAQSRALVNRWLPVRRLAVKWFVERGEKDAIPALIQALRFSHLDTPTVVDALRKLSGAEPGRTWHDWMLWQQAHPEIRPFAGFDAFKADVMAAIDPPLPTA